METHTMRLHLRAALREYDIRRSVWVAERILSAADALDDLNAAALEEVRDFCAEYAKTAHATPMSEFKKAWVNLVVEHLDNMRHRDRRLGRAVKGEHTIDDTEH